jgi:transposase InsO family protein
VTKPEKLPPKLLSDNGPCYISKSLEEYLKDTYCMDQIHGKTAASSNAGKN